MFSPFSNIWWTMERVGTKKMRIIQKLLENVFTHKAKSKSHSNMASDCDMCPQALEIFLANCTKWWPKTTAL